MKIVLTTVGHMSDGEHAGFMGECVATCKYGENAWQTPAHLYSTGTDDPLALGKFVVKEGTPPSYNNWCDLDRLLQTMTHIDSGFKNNMEYNPAIAVGGKHGNPCGASTALSPKLALLSMMAGDPQAIFGGLVMVNFEINEDLCEVLHNKMLDGIIAPSITDEAIKLLRRRGNKCRFIVNPALGELDSSLDLEPRFRYVRGGFLVQPNYTFVPTLDGDKVTKYGKASERQKSDMVLAWAVGSTSNSNTITLVKNNTLIGNGVGQQDRVGAANLAIARAQRSGHDVHGAVAFSDSFFPFPDGVQTLLDAGVRAILTTSGSVNDRATIDVCAQAEQGIVLYMIPDQIGRGFFGH